MRTLTLILLTFLIANCNEGGDGGSSLASQNNCQTCGTFISRDKSQLGPQAQWMLDNLPNTFGRYYSETLEDGSRAYRDSTIVYALNAYANSMTESSNPDAVCDALVGLYDDWGIESEKFAVDNSIANPITGSTRYCVVNITLPNGQVMADPLISRFYTVVSESRSAMENCPNYSSANTLLSISDLQCVVDNDLISEIELTPQGFGNANSEWDAPTAGTYQDSLQDAGLGNRTDQVLALEDMIEAF